MSISNQNRRIAELTALGWSRDRIAAELAVSTTFIFRTLKMMAEVPARPVAPPKPVERVALPVVVPPVVNLPAPKAIDGIVGRPPRGSAPPSYLPTPEEITAACERIQSEWSETERYVRWLIAHSEGGIAEFGRPYGDKPGLDITVVAVGELSAA